MPVEPPSATSGNPSQIKFRETLQDLVDQSPFKSNRKPIWEALNITSAALSQYLQGQSRPRLEVLVALADFFGVSLDYLVLGKTTAIDTPPDQGRAAVRYLDWALPELQAKTERQAWLASRIGQVLGEQLNEVAERVAAESPGFSGMATDDQLLVLEGYSLETRIYSRNLDYDILPIGPGLSLGQFAKVVANNLRADPVRPVRFLVPADEWDRLRPLAFGYKKLLREEGGVPEERLRSCEFRTTTMPYLSGVAFYRLDTRALWDGQPLLATTFEKYMGADGWLGYVMHPNHDTKGNVLFGADEAPHGAESMARLWRDGERVG